VTTLFRRLVMGRRPWCSVFKPESIAPVEAPGLAAMGRAMTDPPETLGGASWGSDAATCAVCTDTA
jgi:hypothetical protein